MTSWLERRSRMRKAQLSIELIAIVSFIVMLFIPLVLFVYYKTVEMNAGVEGMQGRLLASKLAFAANSLGSMGDQNSLKMEFMLPANVRTIGFRTLGEGGEVLITMRDGSEVSQVTKFPLVSDMNYSGGAAYKLELVSQNGTVKVSQSS